MTSPLTLIPTGVIQGGRTEIAQDRRDGVESQLVISGGGTPAKAGRTRVRSSVAYRPAVAGRLMARLVAGHRAADVPNVTAARRVPRQHPGLDSGVELGGLLPGGERPATRPPPQAT